MEAEAERDRLLGAPSLKTTARPVAPSDVARSWHGAPEFW
jgi:hypothetical protein